MTTKVPEMAECDVHPAVSGERISISDCLPTKGSESSNPLVSNSSLGIEIVDVRSEFTPQEGNVISNLGEESFSFQASEEGNVGIQIEDIKIEVESEGVTSTSEFLVPSTKANDITVNKKEIKKRKKVTEEDPFGLPSECDNPKGTKTHGKKKNKQVRGPSIKANGIKVNKKENKKRNKVTEVDPLRLPSECDNPKGTKTHGKKKNIQVRGPSIKANGIKVNKKEITKRKKVTEEDPLGLPSKCDNYWPQDTKTHGKKKNIQVRGSSINANGIKVNEKEIKKRKKVIEEDPLGLPSECDNYWPKDTKTHGKIKNIQVRGPSIKADGIKVHRKEIKKRKKVTEEDPLGLPSECDNYWPKDTKTHDKKKTIQVRGSSIKANGIKLNQIKIKKRKKVMEEDPLGLPSECDNYWSKDSKTHSKKKNIQLRGPSIKANGIKVNKKEVKKRKKVTEEDPLELPSECNNYRPKDTKTHNKKKNVQVRGDVALVLANSHSTTFYDEPNLSQNTTTFEGKRNSIRVRKDLAASPAFSCPPIFYENPNVPQSTTVFQETSQNYGVAFNSAASIPSNCFETGIMDGNNLSGINQQQIYYANGIFFTVNTGIISSDMQSGALVVSNNDFEKNAMVDSYIHPYSLTNSKFPTRNPQAYHPLELNVCQTSTKLDSCLTQQCRELLPQKPANEAPKTGPPVPTVPSFNNGPPILSVYASNCHFGVSPVSSVDHFGLYQEESPHFSLNTENIFSDLQLGTPVAFTNPLEGELTNDFQRSTEECTNSRLSAKSHLYHQGKNRAKRNTSIRGFDCAAWQPRVLLHRSHLSECLAGALKCNKAHTPCSRCPVSKVPTVKKKPSESKRPLVSSSSQQVMSSSSCSGASKCSKVHKSRSRCPVSKVSLVKKKTSKSKRRPHLKRPLVSSPSQQCKSSNSCLSDSKPSNLKDDLGFDVDEKLFSEARTISHEGHFTCVHCSATFKAKNTLRSHFNVCSAEKPALHDSAASPKAEQESKQALQHKLLYLCVQCSAKFKTKDNLKRHLQAHTNNKYSCALCSATFTHKQKIKFHLTRDHSDKDVYECVPCSMKFATRIELRKHSATVHRGKKLFSCAQCPKTFKYRMLLERHLTTHATERPFSCPDCSATFKSREGLKIHSVVHSSERPYLCEHCAKTFKTKNLVKYHLKFHADKRPHKCTQCPAEFYIRGDLKKHSLIHSNTRRFPCPHPNCIYGFHSNSRLNRHLLTHSRVKPYSCDNCPARSKRSDYYRSYYYMKKHRAKCGSNNYQQYLVNFSCHCGGTFKTEDDFRKHWVLHSDEEPVESLLKQGEKRYECAKCPAVRFWAEADLTAHMVYHTDEKPFVCKCCHGLFKTRKALWKHLKVHDGKAFKCSQCSSAFRTEYHLKTHMSVHSKDKPFLCAHCAATFKSFLGLKYHVEHAHLGRS